MSSVRFLREFISARLTAAAEEIFGVFERTIEEELEHQRRQLENSWRTHLYRTEIPLDFSSTEKIPVQQQLCDQGGSFCLDKEEPEPPQIKEEHENLWISQEEEQPVLKQDIDTCVVTPTLEESYLSEPEPKGDWLLSESFPVTEREVSWHEKLSRCAELKSKRQGRNRSLCNTVRNQRSYNSALRSVKCDVCGKAFRYHSNMKVHYRVHTGEKPFSCKICEKAFSHKVNLFVHMRTHTGEKPFLCKICGKGFSHGSSLKKHVGSHR